MSKNGSIKNRPLTVTFHIGGKQVERLTDEQCERMSERLSESMSRYYAARPNEYIKIKEE